MSNIRQEALDTEKKLLSPYAKLCCETLGRQREEEECPIRTAYQRDRDRVIHSNSFRRLKRKTQVFLSPESDHYRTRLTHTLEVAQIARTISRALKLNEDLTEAIALGHDLGHTPFGHAGERALNEVMPGGFRHYDQSLRVVDRLEKRGEGLNLTYEVRDGIVCHTRGKEADTLEGRVVKLSDRIAYINHDIDDAVRGGVMKEEDIPLDMRQVLGFSKTERINTLVISTVENSKEDIKLSNEVEKAFDRLHNLMFDCVYTNPVCKSEETKAVHMIQTLFEYYSTHPYEMPELYFPIAANEGVDRAACDYISGMTDTYAITVFKNLYIPKGWIK